MIFANRITTTTLSKWLDDKNEFNSSTYDSNTVHLKRYLSKKTFNNRSDKTCCEHGQNIRTAYTIYFEYYKMNPSQSNSITLSFSNAPFFSYAHHRKYAHHICLTKKEQYIIKHTKWVQKFNLDYNKTHWPDTDQPRSHCHWHYWTHSHVDQRIINFLVLSNYLPV